MIKMITTQSFRLTPAAYLRVTAAGLISTTAIYSTTLLAICAIAAIFDIRWLILALIIAFLIIPIGIFHIYYSRLLTTEAQRSLSVKHIEIIPNQTLHIIHEAASENHQPLPSETIAWNLISGSEIRGKHLTLYISGWKHPLIIPLSTLPYGFDHTIFVKNTKL